MLERQQFEVWATDGRRLGDMEMLFAWEAWKAATLIEREACKRDCIDVIERRNVEGRTGFNAIHDCLESISKRNQ